MIVHGRALGSARENVVHRADRIDALVRDEHGAVLEEDVRRRSRRCGIVLEREDAAANDPGVRAQGRMSLSRSAAMRSISASAVLVSASASLARRRSKAERMSAPPLPFTAMMKGK